MKAVSPYKAMPFGVKYCASFCPKLRKEADLLFAYSKFVATDYPMLDPWTPIRQILRRSSAFLLRIYKKRGIKRENHE